MIKHHAIYMRVSTKRQDTASQEPELRRWGESHEGDSCWYRDTYTGTSMDRPGFRQLMKEIELGRVDTLVVWRLDRLGRTAKGLTGLFEDLIRCKVNLISLKDGLDLVTPAGRLMANILAGVAAYETEVRASASWRASRPPGIAASTGAARARVVRRQMPQGSDGLINLRLMRRNVAYWSTAGRVRLTAVRRDRLRLSGSAGAVTYGLMHR